MTRRGNASVLALLALIGSACGATEPHSGAAGSHGSRWTSEGRAYPVDHQLTVRGRGFASTTSKTFRCIPGLCSPISVSNRRGVTLTVNLQFEGGPVEIRALSGSRTMKPPVARFRPASGAGSFSYTFLVWEGGAGCRSYALEWRSPSGAPVRATFRDFVVTYETARTRSICE